MWSSVFSNRGIAIIVVTMVLVVAALLGGAMISQTTQEATFSNRTFREKQATYFAESAVERGYSALKADYDFPTSTLPGEGSAGTITDASYTLQAIEFPGHVFPGHQDKIVCFVGIGDAGLEKRRQIVMYTEVVRENVNVWNNAIFGGSGETGGVVNGNCEIHGSIHLLGDGVGEGASAIEAMDLAGKALVHNNYEHSATDASSPLWAKVPALPTDPLTGLETLNARLRVKNGAVGISGNSEIGQASVGGETYETRMSGIYIETDDDPSTIRWTGNQVDENGVPDPDHVFSKNGYDRLYDLGDEVSMPLISEEYVDSRTGITYPTYDDFFTANSLKLPSISFDGTCSARTAVEAYYTPAQLAALNYTTHGTCGFELTSRTGTPDTPTDQTNHIIYNPEAAPGTPNLTVDNMVQINGNLSLGGKKFNIVYSGSGTVYASGGGGAQGDISISQNLLPNQMFPNPDVLGLVAKHDMYLNNTAQSHLAAAFYAGNQVVSSFQNVIAGTFVCTYFNMGRNVPSIYQVPALVDNLPRGLIGSDPIWHTFFYPRSWQNDIVD